MIKKALKQTIRILILLLCIAAVVGVLWLVTKGNTAGDSVAGVQYQHFDTDAFNNKCGELTKAFEANDKDEVIRLYDELYSDCEELETMYCAAYILYTMDMDNEYYSDEQNYSYNALEKCGDKLCAICHDIALSPMAADFSKHVGDTAFKEFKEYQPYTPKELEMIAKEQELTDSYYDLYTDPDVTCEYKGKKWDQDMIDGPEGDDLYDSDPTGYYMVSEEIEKKFNGKAVPIYKELIDLRNEFAVGRGYKNYAAYADEREYYRDYSEEEIKLLHEDVKKVSNECVPLLISFYQSDYDSLPPMSNDELLSTLSKYSEKTSAMAGEAAATLKDEELYSIGDGKSRQPGGYTIYLPKKERPFIFITNTNYSTLPTLTHEFGHFTEYLNDESGNILTDKDCIDLAEIASNGYEGLMMHYYDEVFPKQAESAEKEIIGELMENIIYGALVDEFQRTIYEDPDMTLKEMNQLYAKLNVEYGIPAGDEDGSWAYITHLFEQPMYYVSYAVSGLAAVQIWSRSVTDFDGAVKTWEKFIDEGIYNRTYLDVVGKCGLMKFNEPGAVEAICRPALDAFKN